MLFNNRVFRTREKRGKKGEQDSKKPGNTQLNKDNDAKIIFYNKKKYTEQIMTFDHNTRVEQNLKPKQDMPKQGIILKKGAIPKQGITIKQEEIPKQAMTLQDNKQDYGQYHEDKDEKPNYEYNNELLKQKYAEFYKNAEIAFEELDYESAMLNYLAAAKCSKYTEDALENVFHCHKIIENNAHNNEKHNADNDEENKIEYAWDYRVGVLKEIIELTNWLYTNKPEAGNKIKNYEWYCSTVINYACLTWDRIKLPEQQNKPIEIYEKKSGFPRVDKIEPEFFERYFKKFINFMTLIMERNLKKDDDANDDNVFDRR